MNVVGRFGSLISQGVYSVATPFHPFGGAVDIIVVQQQDGTFRSTPWYVRFGKFQGVLKGAEKMVGISVNGVEADFQMYLDNSGEAYFVKEVDPESGFSSDSKDLLGTHRLEHSVSDSGILHLRNELGSSKSSKIERCESDLDRRFYDFQDDDFSLEDSQEDSPEHESNRFDEQIADPDQNSEVVLISVDGHILTAPISDDENDDIELRTPHLHLGPIEGADFCEENDGFGPTKNPWEVSEDKFSQGLPEIGQDEAVEKDVLVGDAAVEAKTTPLMENDAPSSEQVFSVIASDNHLLQEGVELEDGQSSCLVADSTVSENPETSEFDGQCSATDVAEVEKIASSEEILMPSDAKIAISLCRNELHPGMGNAAAAQAFEKHRVSIEDFQTSMASIVKSENLVIRYREKYLSWEKAAPIVLAMAAFDLDLPVDCEDAIRVEEEAVKPIEDGIGSETPTTPNSSGRRWRLWRIPFRRVKTLEHQTSNASSDDVFVDPEPLHHFQSEPTLELTSAISEQFNSPRKQIIRTNVPTTEQIASLNLKEGQNMITFSFSTRVLGKQQVDAHIYLWMWNARIVISDVDGTITKSDVLGQFMPLVGKDWTQSGVARLFCAIKENGYQLLFLSARAIVQACLTRSFLLNLKQDGKALPSGPVVISPDGLFPSLYREVIRRAPHEFKISCLEDIKALFPADYNPFYAGFGNRETDEISYMKIGIPKGKIFIINPKGEVANSHRIDVKSYTSLHTLVNDMFPPTSLVEQEDYNSWNFWKMPFPDIEC